MNKFYLLLSQARTYAYLARIMNSPSYLRAARTCLELSKIELAAHREDRTQELRIVA